MTHAQWHSRLTLTTSSSCEAGDAGATWHRCSCWRCAGCLSCWWSQGCEGVYRGRRIVCRWPLAAMRALINLSIFIAWSDLITFPDLVALCGDIALSGMIVFSAVNTLSGLAQLCACISLSGLAGLWVTITLFHSLYKLIQSGVWPWDTVGQSFLDASGVTATQPLTFSTTTAYAHTNSLTHKNMHKHTHTKPHHSHRNGLTHRRTHRNIYAQSSALGHMHKHKDSTKYMLIMHQLDNT